MAQFIGMAKRHIAGLALAAVAVSGAPSAFADEITLDVMYPFPEFTRFQEPLAEMFMRENPGVKVRFRLPPPNYMEADLAFSRAALTGDLPDVYFSGYTVLTSMVTTLEQRGMDVPLTPFLEAEGAEWQAANYGPAIMELGQVDGIQYAIPFNASTPIVYFNADLVAQAGHDPENFPQSWNDIIAVANDVSALGADIDGINYSVGAMPGDWLWQATISSLGGAVVNDAGTDLGFDNAVGLAALELLRRISFETDMNVATTPKPYVQQFFAGNLGMFIGSPSSVANFSASVGDRFVMRTAPYPVTSEEGGLPTGGNAVAITAQDPAQQAAAWAYVRFVTGPKAQAYVAKATGYMPTNLGAGDELSEFYAENPQYATALEQVPYARAWHTYPGGRNTEIWRAQREVIGEVQRGNISPEEGLAEIVDVTKPLLN